MQMTEQIELPSLCTHPLPVLEASLSLGTPLYFKYLIANPTDNHPKCWSALPSNRGRETAEKFLVHKLVM